MRRLIAGQLRRIEQATWMDVLVYALVWLLLGFLLGMASDELVSDLFFSSG